MDNTPNEIGFALAKVSTEQFAIIEDAYTNDGNISLGTNIRFGCDADNKMIAVFALFTFQCNEKAFLIIEAGCHFNVREDAWEKMLDTENNSLTAPHGFMQHMTVLTIGTTRGVLHAKTENTPFNQFVLPTINVSEIIQQDSIFKF
ncbi:hypothetical protein BZG02_11280 [Labilibaculum filiforme]|uniref:Uncharacterized protein n=1 Tax=Labilibaculum filiforme TaxID=1940526 RepID=A0A2N3HXI6_9BACT|nr:hypothetical protein [Labilibaculum filiforme]PKQ62775.1 hypothetical protein BZG02_11280 [Labilibaculum filiforme]